MKYDSVRIEFFTVLFDSETSFYDWVDLSDFVDDDKPITFSRGIMGNQLQDRTARAGKLTFSMTMDITDAYDLQVLSRFQTGAYIRVVIEHEGISFVKWFGKIIEILPLRDNLYNNKMRVTVRDYIHVLDTYLKDPQVVTNKDAADICEIIFADLGLELNDTTVEYNECSQVFTTAFDTVTSKQTALGEISKAIISELGYFYERGRTTGADEDSNLTRVPKIGNYKFVIDGRDTRENREYRCFPDMSEQGFLLQENGDFLLQETGDKILLNITECVQKFDVVQSVDYREVDDVNHVYVTVYPKRYGTSTQVLYSIAEPELVEAGDTLNITVSYKDPDNNAASIVGASMVTPVATTDYTANSASDGSGTNLTANMSVVATYHAANVDYAITNTGATDFYVTKLQARGKPILVWDPVTVESKSSGRIEAVGEIEERVNMKMRRSAGFAQAIADRIISQLSTPYKTVDKFTVIANDSQRSLFMCMLLDIGDPIDITLPDANYNPTDYKFYINGLTWTGRRGVWQVTFIPVAKEIVEI